MENAEEPGQHEEGPVENEEDSEAGWSDCEDKDNNSGDESESVSGESDNGDGGSGVSSDESDGGSEKCAICLRRFQGQELGCPECCEHHFCLKCITEWSKKVATCPVDRKIFPSILVKQEVNGVVQRIIDVQVNTNELLFDDYDNDPTYCEICGHCDREDTLLLCDGCDLGYHLECLEPPMEYVPIEDWYCRTCQTQREEQNEEVVARPSRRQIRLPRTGQSRRLLELIRQTARRENPTAEVAGSSAPAPTRRKRTSIRKTPGRKTRRKKKGTRRTKRKTRKGKKKSRVVIQRRPSTTKGRLVVQLGILPPRPGQVYVGLPRCRTPKSQSAQSSNSSVLGNQRYQAGITPLSIYGTSTDIADYVESFSDEEGPINATRQQSSSRSNNFSRPTFSQTESRSIVAPQQSSSADILGPILNSQTIMLTDRNIQVKRDGTLIPSISVSPATTTALTVLPPRSNSMANESTRLEADPLVSSPNSKISNPVSKAPLIIQPSLGVKHEMFRQTSSSADPDNCATGNTKDIKNSNNKTSRSPSTSRDIQNSNKRTNLMSWNSDSRVASVRSQNYGQSGDYPNKARAYENFIHSSIYNSPKQNCWKEQSSEKKLGGGDDEDNIYSDIEEDDTLRQLETEAENDLNNAKDKEDNSDDSDDMVVDEDQVGMVNESQSRRSSESSSCTDERLGGTFEGENSSDTSSSSSSDTSGSTSVKLPDSRPSPILIDVNSYANTNEEVLVGDNVPSSVASSESAAAKYDVSKDDKECNSLKPLNSNEMEEEDLHLQLPPSSAANVEQVPPPAVSKIAFSNELVSVDRDTHISEIPEENTRICQKVVENEDGTKIVKPQRELQEHLKSVSNIPVPNDHESANDLICVLEVMKNPKDNDDVQVVYVTNGSITKKRSQEFGGQTHSSTRLRRTITKSAQSESKFEKDSNESDTGLKRREKGDRSRRKASKERKRDISLQDRRDKRLREKLPSNKSEKSFKEKNNYLERSRRKSISSRSRSRSLSRSRSRRRLRSRSNQTPNTNQSRSRSRSLRRSNQRRLSPSPHRSRSGSRTPLRLRSRSPLRRSRKKRRDLSNERSRKSYKDRKKSNSPSSPKLFERGKLKHKNKANAVAEEKVRTQKGKEKVRKSKFEERVRDPEKKTKKRKQTVGKSVSPTKEIFTNGDSIVVSLNFHKGSRKNLFGSTTSKDCGFPTRDDLERERKQTKRRLRRGRSTEKDENSKPTYSKKPILLKNVETHTHKIGLLPPNLINDEDTKKINIKSSENGSSVTIDALVASSSTQGESNRHGLVADSTLSYHPNQSDPCKGRNQTPTKDDSPNMSTRSSAKELFQNDVSRDRSELSPDRKEVHQQSSPPPSIGSTPAQLLMDSRNVNTRAPASSATLLYSNQQNITSSVEDKPSIGNTSVPLPPSVSTNSNVIPTAANPQMRFTPIVNQNILTSLASLITISKLSEIRLTEDVPNQAVELLVKQKFLKKLNRQERVVEEVKLALKPYYNKKLINKEAYKEILRRAVPKICHNKSGEINPVKIKELVEAYVKKYRSWKQ